MQSLKLLKTLISIIATTVFVQSVWAVDGANIIYDGGTRIEIPEAGFSVKLAVEINVAYSYTAVNRGGENINSFDMYRERLTISGDALDKHINYFLQNNFETSDITAFNNASTREQFGVGNSAPAHGSGLQEGWIQYNFDKDVKLRLGRQKEQFGYALPSSTAKQQFLVRPLAYQVISEIYKLIAGTQAGATGYYSVPLESKSSLNLSLGVFNGQSYAANGTTSYKANYATDTHVTGILSANYIYNGFDRSQEGDVGYTNGVSWTTGLSGSYRKADFSGVSGTSFYTGTASIYNAGIDFGLRSRGFSLQAEAFTSILDREDASTLDNYGYYVQTGYFITPKDMEVALRFSGVDMDRHFIAGGRDSYEYSAVFNKYILGHNLKLQAVVSYYELRTGVAKHDVSKFMLGVCGVL